MKILAVGDVCGDNGLDFLIKNLSRIKKEQGIDLTVVNGENAAGNGLLPSQADEIFAAGADIVTLGNHAMDMNQLHTYLDDNRYIIRPMNLPPQQPGQGYATIDVGNKTVCVVSLLGRVHMGKFHYNDPFVTIDSFLKNHTADVYVLDMHAEGTSEKKAMGYHLDGKFSAIFGTHTHTPTADEQILPKGTGYITDVGMCGPYHSVIGVDKEQSVSGFLGNIIGRYKGSTEPCYLCGVVYTINEMGKCTDIYRITER